MILWLDDEHPVRMREYVAALEKEFGKENVCLSFDVDDAMQSVVDNVENLKLMISDLSMRPGVSYRESREYEQGGYVGTLFMRDVRSLLPKIPMIALTHVPDIDAHHGVLRIGGTQSFRKRAVLPHELAAIARKAIES